MDLKYVYEKEPHKKGKLFYNGKEMQIGFVKEEFYKDEKLSKEAKEIMNKYKILDEDERYIFSEPLSWILDRKRNAIHISRGGKGYLPKEECEPPYHSSFIWKNKVIDMEMYERREKHEKENTIIIYKTYDIENITIPIELKEETLEIMELISEARLVREVNYYDEWDYVEVQQVANFEFKFREPRYYREGEKWEKR